MSELLQPEEIDDALAALNAWSYDEGDGALKREFRFPDFKSALEFVNRIGEKAEAAGHHPDLELAWGRVTVRLTTHSAGGVTEDDLALAETIDLL